MRPPWRNAERPPRLRPRGRRPAVPRPRPAQDRAPTLSRAHRGDRSHPRRSGSGSAAAAAVLAIAAFAMWVARSPQAPPQQPAASAPIRAPVNQSAVAAASRQAAQALESGNFEEARRQADAALVLDPNHQEARYIRDRAAWSADAVSKGVREARAHYAAGRFDEASRAAGNVLSLAPGNADARQLMQDAVARMRGRGADDARTRMIRGEGRRTCRRCGRPRGAGVQRRDRCRAHRTTHCTRPDSSLKRPRSFIEASGLFRSAEISAQSEAESRAQAARARADRERTAPPPGADLSASGQSAPPPPPRAAPPEPLPPAPVSKAPDTSSACPHGTRRPANGGICALAAASRADRRTADRGAARVV